MNGQQPERATRCAVPGFEWARGTHMRDARAPMMARYRLAAEFPDAIHTPTGINELDEVVPFAPGRLVVVAGRQGAGKSALGLQLARYVSTSSPVLYLLTEMSLEEVVTRTVANAAHVDAWKLDKGAHEQTLADADRALEWLAEKSNLTFVETHGGSISDVLGGIREWHAANPTARLLVIDNLWGLFGSLGFKGGDSSGIVSQRLGLLTNKVASLAVELGLCIVLVHHLNRTGAPNQREEAQPDASQLGGSDHIGNWASSVLILRGRPQAKNELLNGSFPGDPTHDVYVVKNRGGKTDQRIGLRFVGSQLRFEGAAAAQPFDTAPAASARQDEYRQALAALPDW
jgi:replicative DNA helicase